MRPPDRVHVLYYYSHVRASGCRCQASLLRYLLYCKESVANTFVSLTLARAHTLGHTRRRASPRPVSLSRAPRIASIVLQRALIRREDTEIE